MPVRALPFAVAPFLRYNPAMSFFEWLDIGSGYAFELCVVIAAICVAVNWVWRAYKSFNARYMEPSDRAYGEAAEVKKMHNEHKQHVDDALARDQKAIRHLQESDRLLLRGHMAIIDQMIGDQHDTGRLVEVRDDINNHLLDRG